MFTYQKIKMGEVSYRVFHNLFIKDFVLRLYAFSYN